MRNRRHTLLWMKDLIDHMSRCHDQLEWTSDDATRLYLADSMIGDLVECQRLCQQLRSDPPPPTKGSASPARDLVMT